MSLQWCNAHAVKDSWEYSLAFSRKLAVFDTWSSLAVHIAMDNTVVMEEISKWLRVWLTRPKREPQHWHFPVGGSLGEHL